MEEVFKDKEIIKKLEEFTIKNHEKYKKGTVEYRRNLVYVFHIEKIKFLIELYETNKDFNSIMLARLETSKLENMIREYTAE